MGVRIEDARELATTLAGELRRRGRDAYDQVSDFAQDDRRTPWPGLIAAGAIGFLAGLAASPVRKAATGAVVAIAGDWFATLKAEHKQIDKLFAQAAATKSHEIAKREALLARLVLSGGTVTAFELDEKLAGLARQNLETYGNVTVVHGDAVTTPLPPSDIVYVNAGVAAPPAGWLRALRPGGRMIFPWRPAERVPLAVLVTRTEKGFACDPFMRSWFIPCFGASAADLAAKIPTRDQAARSRSIWLTRDKTPDRTATAIFGDVWFSSHSLAAKPHD